MEGREASEIKSWTQKIFLVGGISQEVKEGEIL